MRLWLAFIVGLWTPFVDLRNAMMRASKWLHNLHWCWLCSIAMRYSVYAFVALLLAMILWSK